jgi:hypothetical protein
MLDVRHDFPMDWFQRRFQFLKLALQAGSVRRDAAIVPQLGQRSKLASVEIDGGRDVKYVIVYSRKVPENWQPGIEETLTYRRDVAGTDLVYDVTGEFLQGKARPFDCDLRKLPLRIYAILPFQVERLELAAQQRVTAKYMPKHDTNHVAIGLRLHLQDATGSLIAGRLPIFLGLRSQNGLDYGGYTCAQKGRPNKFVSQLESETGDWSLVARLLLTGDELSLPVELALASDERTASDVPLTSSGLTIRRAPQQVQLD